MNKRVILLILGVVIVVLLLFLNTNDDNNNTSVNFDEKEEILKLINDGEYEETDMPSNYVSINVRDFGEIVVRLYPDNAPVTVQNFKELVSNKFYDALTFHRVIKDFMIQTGDPSATGSGGSDKNIKGEFSENGFDNKLSHVRGVVSMARRGGNPETLETYNSASSQFFIVQADSTYLDGKYASFGKVLKGMDVVDKIVSVQTDDNDKPNNDVVIESIRFIDFIESSSLDE